MNFTIRTLQKAAFTYANIMKLKDVQDLPVNHN